MAARSASTLARAVDIEVRQQAQVGRAENFVPDLTVLRAHDASLVTGHLAIVEIEGIARRQPGWPAHGSASPVMGRLAADLPLLAATRAFDLAVGNDHRHGRFPRSRTRGFAAPDEREESTTQTG